MKKLFFPLLSLCLLTTACKDSVPSPTIEMQGLYVNDGEMDYTRQMEALPPLKVDDELEISLKLDGNGEELNTFLVKRKLRVVKRLLWRLILMICRKRRSVMIKSLRIRIMAS